MVFDCQKFCSGVVGGLFEVVCVRVWQVAFIQMWLGWQRLQWGWRVWMFGRWQRYFKLDLHRRN